MTEKMKLRGLIKEERRIAKIRRKILLSNNIAKIFSLKIRNLYYMIVGHLLSI